MFEAVPSYYVLNRDLDPSHVVAVLDALDGHRHTTAIISRMTDAELALNISQTVIRADSDEDATNTATILSAEGALPVLVVGKADFLDAVFPDGQQSPMVSAC